jgi:hypothetical protein
MKVKTQEFYRLQMKPWRAVNEGVESKNDALETLQTSVVEP